jgi:NAD(P)-dependent dehydrogenase (short-subunit alcohol dehydrogenase family)
MGALDGRVAVITGAGRGLGREHALLFAREGARVVVNDLGGNADGTGADAGPAHEVVEEIRAFGGEAVAHTENVATWDGGRSLIQTAIDSFGELHVVVNNAGILRDRMLTNMSEEEWDAVINVHLKGHFVPTRFAAEYWRGLAKAGTPVKASVIGTSSTSGLFGNVGQTNYGAAKTGIATFMIICQMELGRYGVRCNAIAPAAMTRLIQTIPGVENREGPKEGEFDPSDPANVSPFVAYLATEDCPIQGRVFFVAGGEVALFEPFSIVERIRKDGRWTVAELQKEAAHLADVEFDLGRSGFTMS